MAFTKPAVVAGQEVVFVLLVELHAVGKQFDHLENESLVIPSFLHHLHILLEAGGHPHIVFHASKALFRSSML